MACEDGSSKHQIGQTFRKILHDISTNPKLPSNDCRLVDKIKLMLQLIRITGKSWYYFGLFLLGCMSCCRFSFVIICLFLMAILEAEKLKTAAGIVGNQATTIFNCLGHLAPDHRQQLVLFYFALLVCMSCSRFTFLIIFNDKIRTDD